MAATAAVFNFSWSDHGTSFRNDVVGIMLALALHAPLYFMKFDTTKKAIDIPKQRLVEVDLMDQLVKPVEPAPAPVVKEEKSGIMQKLKQLVKHQPPPPPPKPVQKELPPPKVDVAPKQIQLDARTNLPEANLPKLTSKSGEIKTAVDPALIEQKKLAMAPAGIAPISASKVGATDNRAAVKQDRGAFAVSQRESIKSIGGDGPAIGGVAAPSIAIPVGNKASQEKFSAARPQKSDKGKIGGIPVEDVGGGPKLGLRDSIIMRDAQPGTIAIGKTAGGAAGGVSGGVEGGIGTKKDMGSFSGGSGKVGFGDGSGIGQGAIKSGAQTEAVRVQQRPKEKSMFQITGELKDRTIVRKVIPEYPDWAQAKGIEASVTLRFAVSPTGDVKDTIVVVRTSGYDLLDKSAMRALLKWKFVPLPPEENREEVGDITFNYALR